MNYSKLQLPKTLRLPKGLLIFIVLALFFLIGISRRLLRAHQLEGKWTLFDSQNGLVGDDDPDGFKLEYPEGWEKVVYSNGGIKNSEEQRAGFYSPYYLFGANTYVSIWWRRVDDSWTRYDARDWYIEDVGFGLDHYSLEQDRNAFQETNIGVGNYPALEQTFDLGGAKKRKVVLFVVSDEAFAIDFQAQNYTEMEEIFGRMLDSFEIYQ